MIQAGVDVNIFVFYYNVDIDLIVVFGKATIAVTFVTVGEIYICMFLD